MTRWYVAQTQAQGEERARLNLERQGFRTYLPRYRRERRHARRRDVVKAPLFPGYIFIELDLEQSPWRSINGTFGVTRLVFHAHTPAAVPPVIVADIQARAGAIGRAGLPPASSRTA